MSPEQEELLKRSVTLAESNNDMLRSIQRSMRLGRVMSLLYWVFIIGSAIGAYYLVQPYIQGITGAYSNISSPSGISGIIDSLKQQYSGN